MNVHPPILEGSLSQKSSTTHAMSSFYRSHWNPLCFDTSGSIEAVRGFQSGDSEVDSMPTIVLPRYGPNQADNIVPYLLAISEE